MEISCYIVDDETHAINVLKRYIDKTPGLLVLGSETDPLKAWSAIDSKIVIPDIVFLDIDMPKLSGIELADLIKPTQIIFTTAHPDYAINAFESDATDYLLKPVTYERFLKAISKAKDNLSFKNQLVILNNEEEDFYIKSGTKGKMVKLKYDDIYYIEARANYLEFHLPEKSYLTYLTMKEIEEKLPAKKFIRVHKSYIVNIKKIIALDANQIFLEKNGPVDIGRSYRSSLLSVINPRLISSKRMP